MSQHIACIPTGVHLGSKRFLNHYEPLTLKAWRCELTGLSQLHNLYFIACNDTIHVYQPSFPDQKLSEEPALILDLPVSPEAGNGFAVDPDDPHSVNRILVDYLGCDEILLVTCDDGDVIGYRVDEILKTLERRTNCLDDESDSDKSVDVKVFLHRNVGASAWGLAVHREGRMIAISANTHKVTVLAYALATDTSDDRSQFKKNASFQSSGATELSRPRRKDYVLILKGKTNIPAVSFNNTGDDHEGRWLFSTSIDGKVMVWDLHQPRKPARIIQLGWCVSTQEPRKAPGLMSGLCACPDRANVAHAAWGALMLDTRSAYEISADEESSWQPQQLRGNFFDHTHRKDQFSLDTAVMLNSTLSSLPNFDPSPTTAVEDTDAEMSFISQDSDDTSGSDSNETSSGSPVLETGTADIQGDPDTMGDENIMPGDLDLYESDDASDRGEDESIHGSAFPISVEHQVDATDLGSLLDPNSPTSLQPTQSLPLALNTQPLSPMNATHVQVETLEPAPSTSSPWHQTLNTDDLLTDTDSEESEEINILMPTITQSLGLLSRMPRKRPYCEIEDICEDDVHAEGRSLREACFRPCLILTKEEMFLVQRPTPSFLASSFHDPIMTMRRPLHPGPWAPFLGSFDRLCYCTQIPELGIFIVASPVGRAAVFSLYWSRSKDDRTAHYGFSLEYILPFVKGNHREATRITKARLVGIAVAPVQGMYDKPRRTSDITVETRGPQSRRWRLIMYHTDHTVLSFELFKRRPSDVPGMGELIV